MNKDIRILLLGGSKRVSVAKELIQAGAKLGHAVHIYSYELNEQEPIASIATIIKGLKWKDENLHAHLQQVIKQYSINIVIPFVDIATIICSELKEILPGVFFCCSHISINKAMYDKHLSDEWFINNGFTVPSKEIKLPLVAKPVTGSGAKGMYILQTEGEWSFFAANKLAAEYMVQQFIDGEEFSVDCYVDKNGKPISVVPRKRLEVINGEATRSVTIKDKAVINLSLQILSKGLFNGPVTIQFIKEKTTGTLYLIEINPRLGSGVLTSVHAGANICDYIIKEFLNTAPEPNNDWKEGVIMTRAFQEFYFYATDN